MYYEEQVINGVLCWRGSPSGEWVPKTPEQLTAMLLEARQAKLEDRLAGARESLAALMRGMAKHANFSTGVMLRKMAEEIESDA